MSNIKVTKRNVKPSADQLAAYHQNRNRQRPVNLRFGKIVILSDQDLDG